VDETRRGGRHDFGGELAMSKFSQQERGRILAECRATLDRTAEISAVASMPSGEPDALDHWRSLKPKPAEPERQRGLDTPAVDWSSYVQSWRDWDRDILVGVMRELLDRIEHQAERISAQSKRLDEMQSKCLELEAEAIQIKREQLRQHTELEDVQGRSGKVIDLPSMPWKASKVQ
jgi:hypothetical protein